MKIADLIVKKLEGNLTEEEEVFFGEWLEQSHDNAAMYSRLESLKKRGADFTAFNQLHPKSAWENVNKKLVQQPRKSSSFLGMGYLKYAAIFICLLGLGYGYWSFYPNEEESIIDPNAITLELGNGEVKVLSTEKASAITDASGQLLGQREGSQLDYTKSNIKEELVYNTLTIPHGKRFNIVLSDGSLVHLNAGSSIKYPVKFLKDQERKVFLEGEAFFDVSKDKERPFIVSSDNMNIQVLGTKFNVSSYPEDPHINTVLVEGSVSIYGADSQEDEAIHTPLEPGYKATWQKSSAQIQLKKVNTDIYTGWLNGKLVLKRMPFKDIAKKLQRHYNITIDNRYQALDEKVFTATFDIESIEQVLDVFSEDTSFNYQKEGNNITIYKAEEPNP